MKTKISLLILSLLSAAVCTASAAPKKSASSAKFDAFEEGTFENVPAGLRQRVNTFFHDILGGEPEKCYQHISPDHLEMDIADDDRSMQYIVEQLVDHPDMFSDSAEYKMLWKQFPDIQYEEFLGLLNGAVVTRVESFQEEGKKHYRVMGELKTKDGKKGKFCLRLRQEGTDPDKVESFLIKPSAVG